MAAATRGRVYHLRRRPPPPSRGRRVLALLGTLLVHLFCLFAFVLGPAYEPVLPSAPPSEQLLQVRLIEPPEPPPPPPVRGTPPKERGPRHQGQRPPSPRAEPSANIETVVASAAPPAAPANPSLSPAPAALPEPLPPVSLPAPAPLSLPALPTSPPPQLAVTLPAPSVLLPPPPQPEPARPAQPEGNRPLLSPTALALPKTAAPAAANPPAMALQVGAPATIAPLSVAAESPPPVPELPRPQPQPLPPASVAARSTPLLTPRLAVPQAVAQAEVPPASEPVAVAPASPSSSQLPPAKLDLDRLARTPAIPPSALRPALDTSIAVAPTTPLPAAATSEPVAAEPTPTPPAAADVSRAPDAIPEGSDTATVGEPAPAASAVAPIAPHPSEAVGKSAGKREPSLAAGKPGGDRPGALQGADHGAVGDYVQLKPTGDTAIMRHRAPDVGYRATRFEQDWTPEDESSVDTALRRAVEKTTLKHTFHLPRGVRVECAVKPLLPIALFGCRNPDPPPAPVAASVYRPLHLAPAEPLAPASAPAPAASTPTPMVKFDNSAECAAARVAGGPLPPGCVSELQPIPSLGAPAPTSSSWVPAGDQFH